ncbi:MAG: DUF3048 domain-containing protein [Actinomycetota bacterium]|nr:DUF3048 domain-containing protein [Actinomycetota bacterium]
MAVLPLLLAVLVAGCSGGHSAAAPAPPPATEPETTTTTVAPTTTTLPPTYPLTGLPLSDPAKAARPAVAVKIDNIEAARPQAGIRAADVVYEEFTEGVTRFIVVYHSNEADVVGPVRSVRPADPSIVAPLGGILAFSGGSPGAVAIAQAAPLTLVTEGDTAVMYRRPGRAAPHNLYTSTQGLYLRAPPSAGSPRKFADFLTGGRTFTGPGATPVSSISLIPAPYVTASYDWDAAAGAWLRSTDGRPHLTEEGRIAPTNVIVQFTPYTVFVDDEAVQYPEVVGTGDAWIFAAGMLVQGTWSKPSTDAVTTYTDSAGAPIALPPGQTWVHLVAPGSTVTTG